MTHTGTGLGDKARTWIGIAIGMFATVAVSLAGLPEDQRPPVWVMTMIGVAMTAVMAFERLSGIRDATSARVAKEVDTTIDNARDTSESK